MVKLIKNPKRALFYSHAISPSTNARKKQMEKVEKHLRYFDKRPKVTGTNWLFDAIQRLN
ncbi:hypothetical protein ABG752_03660 [Streptococcus iniae]